ncbi:MAG: tRNA preQ1(34) S-adenosylmethionine ribosyltransferase-isomerase QueA [Chloroflexi bacterium]|nr:tRNA preQ1(34) S-adenosylmethionine ribosyltransferase-isomerase QueA [Chloroflexota bacterium]
MKTSDFDYKLPPERIAQTPVEPRDASRLMVLNRENDELTHSTFNRIEDFLLPGDLLVVNQTRVIPARIFAHKIPTGGKIEILLLNRRDEHTWECLVGGKRMDEGKAFELENGVKGEIIAVSEGASRVLRFEEPIDGFLNEIGTMPLPPYIHEKLEDPERYQTVYSKEEGSAAAPTAGLHFTPELISGVRLLGVKIQSVTLHVGLDTFAPVTEENAEDHKIHTEWCSLPFKAARMINRTRAYGGRVIGVGTTSVRVLETAARNAEGRDLVGEYKGPTDLFILPGYEFKATQAMITNFHLPKSSLMMMVSAFAGHEKIMSAYQTAIEEKYRFYSFGDAMFIY